MNCPRCNTRLKDSLLAHYAKKQPNFFYQFDAFLASADTAGDCFFGWTFELMQSSNVRVLISPETPREEVIRLLDKIRACVADKENIFQDRIVEEAKIRERLDSAATQSARIDDDRPF